MRSAFWFVVCVSIIVVPIVVVWRITSAWEGDDGALSQREAERGVQMQLTEPPPPPAILGPLGLPVAPYWLDGCEEFRFYADQFGLPKWFDGIAWRESNCRNEDGVRTSCCHGYLQLSVSLHLSGPLRDDYHACGVYGPGDVNSDNAADKQRHLCAAAALYRSEGSDPWRLTR